MKFLENVAKSSMYVFVYKIIRDNKNNNNILTSVKRMDGTQTTSYKDTRE